MKGSWGDRVKVAAGKSVRVAALRVGNESAVRPEIFTVYIDTESSGVGAPVTRGPSSQDPTYLYSGVVKWLCGNAEQLCAFKLRATGNVFVVAGQAIQVDVASDDVGNPDIFAHVVIVPGMVQPTLVENDAGSAILAAGTRDIVIPRFASSVRFSGWPATVTAKFRTSGGVDIGAAMDCSLENFRAIPRHATGIRITNGDAASQQGVAQFEVG